MADVVGSDEGAEAAGAGAGQAAGAESRSASEAEAAAQAPPEEPAAEAEGVGEDPADTAPEDGADAISGGDAEPEAEVEAAVEAAVEVEVEVEAEAAVEVEVEAEAEAAVEVEVAAEVEAVAEVVAAEAVEAAATEVAADAEAAADAAAATEVVTVEVISEEAVLVAEALGGPEVPAAAVVAEAAAPPPRVPPAYASAAAFPPPRGPVGAEGVGTPPPPALNRRRALLIGGAAVVVIGGAVTAFAASGSSGGTKNSASGKAGSAGAGTGAKTSASATAAAVPAALISTVPANGATGVDPSKPITVQVSGGTIESVDLSGQQQTNGTLSTDRSSWTSANVLSVDAGYQLTVTAKNPAGKSTTTQVSFRTLSPSATFGVSEVVPPRGSTVGVGQPIRVTFSNYVPQEYQAALEKACVVTTSPPIAGAWYWVSNSTDGAVVDWRPENFWPVNTKVTIDFNLDGVRLGEHQFGVEDYKAHEFTISDRDLRLIVDKDTFKATCYRNGQVIRTFPIDTGMTTAETFVTYTGTMAVLGKGNPVEMKGNYGPGDTYDDFVNWATQITWSGTYVHAAPWDADIGFANDDSHGCVHCRTEDAEWFYDQVIPGDVVTINGSRTRTVDVGNGICTFTLDWSSVLKGSAYGATLNGRPVSA